MNDQPQFASRSDFLAPCPRRYGTFALPHSGRFVRFRSLSEAEFAKFEMDSMKATDEGLRTDEERLQDARERLIVLCLCDGAGAPLLTAADVGAIGELDAGDTGALYDVLREHCGIGRRLRDAQAKRETVKKNSNTTGGGASP